MKYLRFSSDDFKQIILSQTIPGFSKLTICLLDNSTWMLSRYLYPMLEILISLFPIYSSTSIPHQSKGYYQSPNSKTHNSWRHLVVAHKLIYLIYHQRHIVWYVIISLNVKTSLLLHQNYFKCIHSPPS